MDEKNNQKHLLGEILMDMGLITQEELEHALLLQKKNKRLLGQILISLGYCSPELVISALEIQGGSIFDSPL